MIKKFMIVFITVFLCGTVMKTRYVHAEQSALINNQRFYVEEVHTNKEDLYIFRDESNHVFNIKKDESNNIYLNNKLIGEVTSKYELNERSQLKNSLMMKASGTGWSAWSAHGYVDGNVKINLSTISLILTVLGAVSGCSAAAVSGALGGYINQFVDKAYYRQCEQIRYSKYGTQVRYVTQFYKDSAHKHPVGKKTYSKPIFKG